MQVISHFLLSIANDLRKMVKAKRFIVVKHFQNDPKPSDLQLIEEELPALQNGGKNLITCISIVDILFVQFVTD
mgnify:CR=1 FL=1